MKTPRYDPLRRIEEERRAQLAKEYRTRHTQKQYMREYKEREQKELWARKQLQERELVAKKLADQIAIEKTEKEIKHREKEAAYQKTLARVYIEMDEARAAIFAQDEDELNDIEESIEEIEWD